MERVLILLADGFEEIEAITVIDVLRRAGIKVVVTGLNQGEVKGAHDISLVCESSLDQIDSDDFDMIVLPGGQPGVDNLRKDKRVLDLLRSADKAKKKIAAICAAPLALRDAGLISGRDITSYPSFKEDLADSSYKDDRVVIDANLVTSRGPGTALEFSLTLVEILLGPDQASQLSQEMIVNFSARS